MAIDTLQKLIDGLQHRYILTFSKASISSMTSGQLGSRWRAAGSPGLGEIPTIAAPCDSNTLGAWKLPTSPPGTNMYIGEINVSQSVLGQFILFDRLSHMGGLVGNITTEQIINLDVSTAVSEGRIINSSDGIIWALDTYTNLGATSTTAIVTYTNGSGISGRTTTVTIPGTMRAGSIWPILPNDEDKNISSIQSIQLSVSTGTAGNFGVTARIRIAEVPIDSTSKNFLADYAMLALPKLIGTECLEIGMVCGTTSQGVLIGNAAIIRN